jgi:hypothetical protein
MRRRGAGAALLQVGERIVVFLVVDVIRVEVRPGVRALPCVVHLR